MYQKKCTRNKCTGKITRKKLLEQNVLEINALGKKYWKKITRKKCTRKMYQKKMNQNKKKGTKDYNIVKIMNIYILKSSALVVKLTYYNHTNQFWAVFCPLQRTRVSRGYTSLFTYICTKFRFGSMSFIYCGAARGCLGSTCLFPFLSDKRNLG